jgi:hypothetical protein
MTKRNRDEAQWPKSHVTVATFQIEGYDNTYLATFPRILPDTWSQICGFFHLVMSIPCRQLSPGVVLVIDAVSDVRVFGAVRHTLVSSINDSTDPLRVHRPAPFK